MAGFVLVVHLTVKSGAVETFMPYALENARCSRHTEPGCRQFDVLVDPADATRVVYYEVYDDQAAFEAHQQSAHFQHYAANALQYLDSRERVTYQRVAP